MDCSEFCIKWILFWFDQLLTTDYLEIKAAYLSYWKTRRADLENTLSGYLATPQFKRQYVSRVLWPLCVGDDDFISAICPTPIEVFVVKAPFEFFSNEEFITAEVSASIIDILRNRIKEMQAHSGLSLEHCMAAVIFAPIAKKLKQQEANRITREFLYNELLKNFA